MRITPSSLARNVLSRLRAARRRAPLSRQQERGLARRIRDGSDEALNELVEANLSFVAKLALEYRHLGLPFEDLLNEGTIGLIEAGSRYDAERGTKFITYAAWWIRKCILRALNEQSTLVRVPSYQMQKFRELRERVRDEQHPSRPGAVRESAPAELQLRLSRIEATLQIGLVPPRSLDETLGQDDRRLADSLADPSGIDVERALIRKESTARLTRALTRLSPREGFVIAHRYGLNGRPALALSEIGRRLGVSRERVRQIENDARGRLRRQLLRDGHPPRRGARSAEPDR